MDTLPSKNKPLICLSVFNFSNVLWAMLKLPSYFMEKLVLTLSHFMLAMGVVPS
jgi:hypothetical protein